MNWTNNFTKKLNLQYPIIQAPMFGVSTPEMAAAISNLGGLGSLAVGGLSPDATIQLIRKTKSLTNKPFAVNLFVHEVPSYNEEEILPMKKFLISLAKKRGYVLSEDDLTNFQFYTYRDQVDILIKENIRIVSFTFGNLDKDSINQLKETGSTLIGTATCLEEAVILHDHGIDMITAQGIEAGGHRGSFIENKDLPEIGLIALVPQIVKEVPLPVIAAGGIYNAQTIRAAFDLGAVAVQIGSAFIASTESLAISSYQQLLSNTTATDTTLTRAFSGRWARGITNEFMREVEKSGLKIPPYPIQNSLTTKFRKLAQQNNDKEYTNLWAGQSAKTSEIKASKDIFLDLIKQVEESEKQ